MVVSRSLVGAAAAAVLCSCATGPAGDGFAAEQCVAADALREWRPLDADSLLLFAADEVVFRVELRRPARGLTEDVMIGVYDRDGRICADDAVIVETDVPEVIAIRSMRRLTAQELQEVYAEFGTDSPVVIEVLHRSPAR